MSNKEDVPEIIQEAFPDSPGVRPGPQAGPLRTYNVVIPPSYLYHLSAVYQATYAVGVENERLRVLLRQKQMAEEAYSRSLAVANDCICTIGKSGMLLPVLNRTVQMACYGIPEPPLNDPPVYNVLFSKAGVPLYLTDKEFFNDNVLISKIQSLPGVEVTIRKTVKATATLLRMAITKDILTIPISIYAGWTAEGEGNFNFTTFFPFSAHFQGGPALTQSCPLPPVPPSATELAIKNWLPALAPIQGDFLRWFLWIWSHAAALTSLLDGLGFCPPLGLYLYCEGPNALTYLRRLLCFYGDEAVSLDLPPELFSRLLMYRKDQPLVIEDTDRTKSAGDNASIVDEMLVTRSLPWKNGRDCVQLPIRALPTIIASSVSGLSCNPGLITLDMPADQFDLDDFWSEFPGQEKQNDYLMNFLSHVKSHIPELRTALETAREEAWRLCDNNQAENCVQFLGIVLALHRFLREFYADHHVDLPVDMTEEELTAQLLEALDEVSIKKEAANCLDSQFVTVTRTMIGHGDLSIQPLAERHAAPKDTLTVYADDGSLYFTPAAFDQVCKWLGYSRPMVLRALTSANLIQGSPINQSTAMTRIRLWDVYGRRYSAHVYRLRRDVFEQMGDLFLDNEGESL